MISFLLIDENSVVASLQSIITRVFPDAPVYTASGGTEAWMLIQTHAPTIIISDLQLPGMSGLDLCKRVRANDRFKDIYFIVFTSSTNKEQRIEILESGADEYLSKPINIDEFTTKLRSAIRIVQMQDRLLVESTKLKELTVQLERDFDEMAHLSIGFLQSRFAQTIPMLARVTKISLWIAGQFTEITDYEKKELEYASQLCYVGKLFLPDALMYQPISIDGKPAHELMAHVPHSAKMILSTVKRFDNIGDILHRLYENFDGSGFPERQQSWQIPLSARILRVALDFEEIRERTRKSPQDTLSIIQRDTKRLYDHRIVLLLSEYVSRQSGSLSHSASRPVQFQDLKDGMVLARDVYTNSGLKLLPADATLSTKTIERILTHASTDPIIGNIYVRLS
ncbi:MAG: response regulator [Ignavibacteria bacterium]|nr:response regulator [Ignavibacteria bacterium]